MRRAWIATALLAGSWLMGLSYYELACLPAWIVLIAAGISLMAGLSTDNGQRTTDAAGTLQAVAALLMLPVVWFAPWPYRRRAAGDRRGPAARTMCQVAGGAPDFEGDSPIFAGAKMGTVPD